MPVFSYRLRWAWGNFSVRRFGRLEAGSLYPRPLFVPARPTMKMSQNLEIDLTFKLRQLAVVKKRTALVTGFLLPPEEVASTDRSELKEEITEAVCRMINCGIDTFLMSRWSRFEENFVSRLRQIPAAGQCRTLLVTMQGMLYNDNDPEPFFSRILLTDFPPMENDELVVQLLRKSSVLAIYDKEKMNYFATLEKLAQNCKCRIMRM